MKTNIHHFTLIVLILERFLQLTISSTLDDKFIAINLTIVYAENVTYAPNNYFHSFVSPVDEILATPLHSAGRYLVLWRISKYTESFK